MQLSECDRDVDVDVILRDAGTRGEWIAGYTDRSGRDRVRKRKEKKERAREMTHGVFYRILSRVFSYLSLYRS